jgi:hypothetical protein
MTENLAGFTGQFACPGPIPGAVFAAAEKRAVSRFQEEDYDLLRN